MSQCFTSPLGDLKNQRLWFGDVLYKSPKVGTSIPTHVEGFFGAEDWNFGIFWDDTVAGQILEGTSTAAVPLQPQRSEFLFDPGGWCM